MTLKYILPTALVSTCIAMGSAAWAADCTPAHTFETLVPGKLTVTVYDAPPFSTTGNGVTFGGVDADILEVIAEKECLEIVPVVVDPAAAIQYVIAGKADIAAGDWYRSVARSKVMGLSFPTYLDQMGIYSRDGISKIDDIVGRKVGAVSGYIWVPALQKLLGNDLKLYPNPVALAQDLDGGRIDVAVDSYGTGAYAQKRGGYPGIEIKVSEPDERVPASIEPPQANLPFSKNNEGLGKALDELLETMHSSGQIATILSDNGLDPSGADVGEPRMVQ
ncbi:transporter substrate-binding domain-containing protein [uncultured Hoeflea sp.]|uniref:substrate-binding periplasmic protein n=1 Tax=uncultured Hoeflea sp. TaxID=538666 RepID=UPI0030DA953E